MDLRRFSQGGGDVDCISLDQQFIVDYYVLPFVGDIRARYLYPELQEDMQLDFEEEVRMIHARLRGMMQIPDSAFRPYLPYRIPRRSFIPLVFTSEYSRTHRWIHLKFQQRLDILVKKCYRDKCIELSDIIQRRMRITYLAMTTVAIGLGCVIWYGCTKIRSLMS
ncbi:uncharacterized protein LOC119688981 [Teleopsis dalmanni]|uniref:uncharacterized protein LOC119688981 n=1 Tax=Teleopsis dalmanni TaxID=139649 RepID=UPI000D32CD40|nr:uncharacterized protein LOC119688981 [Teleopsis dalmanni]